MNVFTDIESIPEQPEAEAKLLIAENIQPPGTIKKEETKQEWHAGTGKYAGVKESLIEETYRKTSLDGARGQICSVAWAVGDGEIMCTEESKEALILAELFDRLMAELKDRPPYFIGHYISSFDLPFIFKRAVINNIRPPFQLMGGRHGQEYFDTRLAWAGYKEHISQANLCKALGIEGKPDDIDGSKVWDFYQAGDIARIREYNKDDVDKVRQIFNRINFV